MNKVHNIKIELENVSKTFFCPECSFTDKNFANIKTHMIGVHKKKNHEWMTGEFLVEYVCSECDSQFSEQTSLGGQHS